VRHIPGRLNVLADSLSRSLAPDNTEWELHQAVFQSIVLHWGNPNIDLFATSLNFKVTTFVSPVPDPRAFAVDAMSLSWEGVFAYAFPLFIFLAPVLHKITGEKCRIIDIAPAWPKQAWFANLLRLSCARPLVLPLKQNLLSQFKGGLIHLSPERLHLHAWFLSGIISDRKAFLKKLPSTSPGQCENPLASSMMQSGQSSLIGVLEGRLIHSKSLSQQLADFLVFLFEVKGLVPSTVKGYRSAISRTIHISGGEDFGNNQFISLLVRNFSLERPRQKGFGSST
jgi:hypothetical protein